MILYRLCCISPSLIFYCLPVIGLFPLFYETTLETKRGELTALYFTLIAIEPCNMYPEGLALQPLTMPSTSPRRQSPSVRGKQSATSVQCDPNSSPLSWATPRHLTLVAWMKILTSSSILFGLWRIACLSRTAVVKETDSARWSGHQGKGSDCISARTRARLDGRHVILRHIVLYPGPVVVSLFLGLRIVV